MDSHSSGDRPDVDNNPSSLLSHRWNYKLGESQRGEEIGFKCLAGNVDVRIQDRAYSNGEFTSHTAAASRFTWTQYPGVVDQHIDPTRLSKHLVDDALPIFFVSHIQDDLSATK